MLTAKLLGRRSCAACGKGFNVADVIDPAKGVHMPALLPLDGSTTTCDCGSPLTMREDDTEDVILQRTYLLVFSELELSVAAIIYS